MISAPYKDIVMLSQKGIASGNEHPGNSASDDNRVVITKFLHPKGFDALYLKRNGNFFEIQNSKPRKYGCWMIDQRMCSSNKIHFATKVDPRFLCLPYFEKSDTRFCPLDQIILAEDGCSKISLEDSSRWKLDDICDVKDLGDMLYYRFNEGKTIAWLREKVDRTALILMNQRIKTFSRQNTAVSSTFHNSQMQNIVAVQPARAVECTGTLF
jgi:ribonuclease H2 subunit B